jgi:SOS-response transcriptional repressor LexA
MTVKRSSHVNWATFAVGKLREGQEVQIKPRGHSMTGKVNDGDLVTLQPCSPDQLRVGDIVLVQVKGNVLLHLIKAIDRQRFLIGNNRGGINGWVGPHAIYGQAIKVEGR